MSSEDCGSPEFDNLSLVLKFNFSSCVENERRYYYTFDCDIGYAPSHNMPSNDVICVQKNSSSRWIGLEGDEEKPACRLYTELIAGIVVVTVLVAIIIAVVCQMIRIKRRLVKEQKNIAASERITENPYISPCTQRKNSIQAQSPLPRRPQHNQSPHLNRGYSENSTSFADTDDYTMPTRIQSEIVVEEGSEHSFRSTHDYDTTSASEGDSGSSRRVSPVLSCDQGIVLPTVKFTRNSDELSSSAEEKNENKNPAIYRESIGFA